MQVTTKVIILPSIVWLKFFVMTSRSSVLFVAEDLTIDSVFFLAIKLVHFLKIEVVAIS